MLSVKSLPENGRSPSGLSEPAPLRRPRRPAWWLLPLVLLALVGAGGLADWQDRPSNLTEIVLTGPRTPTPQDIVVILDESGSFADYTQVRADVVDSLVEWAPANLRADDTITVLAFADEAQVRLPTTRVEDLPAGRVVLQNQGALGGGTAIQPVLSHAAESISTTNSRHVIVVTDTIVADISVPDLDQLIGQLRVDSMAVIVPKGVRVQQDWHDAFPYEQVFEASPQDPAATALAIGYALAHATGQSIEKL